MEDKEYIKVKEISAVDARKLVMEKVVEVEAEAAKGLFPTEEQIKLIKSCCCPVCKSGDIDTVSAGTMGGTDDCGNCGAYWTSIVVRKDEQDFDKRVYCREDEASFNERMSHVADKELFNKMGREYQKKWDALYTWEIRIFPKGNAIVEGLKAAFPEFFEDK